MGGAGNGHGRLLKHLHFLGQPQKNHHVEHASTAAASFPGESHHPRHDNCPDRKQADDSRACRNRGSCGQVESELYSSVQTSIVPRRELALALADTLPPSPLRKVVGRRWYRCTAGWADSQRLVVPMSMCKSRSMIIDELEGSQEGRKGRKNQLNEIVDD